MITKELSGLNTKEFVGFANGLIKKSKIESTIKDMILEAYENGVPPNELKDYLYSVIEFKFTEQTMRTHYEFIHMIKRRDDGHFNLSDEDVLANAAHEAWKMD